MRWEEVYWTPLHGLPRGEGGGGKQVVIASDLSKPDDKEKKS